MFFKIVELHNPFPVRLIGNVDNRSTTFSINSLKLIPNTDAKFVHNFETWEVRNQGEINESRQRVADKINISSIIKGSVTFNNPATAQTLIRITVPNQLQQIEILLKYFDGTSDFIPQTINITNLCNQDDTSCLNKSDFLNYYQLVDFSAFGKKFDFVMQPSAGSRAPCNVVFCSPDPE